MFGTDDTERRKGDEEHSSWATPEPFIQSPGGAKVKPSGHGPPSMNAIERNKQAAGEKKLPQKQRLPSTSCITSESSETTSFAQSGAQKSSASDVAAENPTGTQTHRSTADWETSISESINSESHITHDSQTIISPMRVPSSYIDGVFTMDMDMEKTPHATSSFFKLCDSDSKNLASSPPFGTPTSREKGTIRPSYSRRWLANGPGPSIAVEDNMGDGHGFSFKKRRIKVLGGKQPSPKRNQANPEEDTSVWSDSASESESPDDFDKNPGETTCPVQASPTPDGNMEERQASGPQSVPRDSALPKSSRTSTRWRQVPPDVSPNDPRVACNRIKVPEMRQKEDSRTDDRVSRFSCRDDISEFIPAKNPISAKSSHSTATETASEVSTLMEKNYHSREKFLSPVLELDSQDSLKGIEPSPLDGLPLPDHCRYMGGLEKSMDETMTPAAGGKNREIKGKGRSANKRL